MRRLVPRRLYPGRNHVGAAVASAAYPASMPVYDGVDWYWGRSLTHALKFLDRQRPTVLILQWWTGAVLHTYLRLARHATRLGARVILEWHEGQDVGEADDARHPALRPDAHAAPAGPGGCPCGALQLRPGRHQGLVRAWAARSCG